MAAPTFYHGSLLGVEDAQTEVAGHEAAACLVHDELLDLAGHYRGHPEGGVHDGPGSASLLQAFVVIEQGLLVEPDVIGVDGVDEVDLPHFGRHAGVDETRMLGLVLRRSPDRLPGLHRIDGRDDDALVDRLACIPLVPRVDPDIGPVSDDGLQRLCFRLPDVLRSEPLVRQVHLFDRVEVPHGQ